MAKAARSGALRSHSAAKSVQKVVCFKGLATAKGSGEFYFLTSLFVLLLLVWFFFFPMGFYSLPPSLFLAWVLRGSWLLSFRTCLFLPV